MSVLTRRFQAHPGAPIRVAVASFIVLALTSLGGRAYAGGPWITATPNPVVIPVDRNGTVTLRWETFLKGGSVVTMSRDGGAENVVAGSQQSSGTAEILGIAYGSRYVARLYQVGATGQPLASQIITTARPPSGPLKADPVTLVREVVDSGCAAICIADVQIEAHGTYAVVRVQTARPTNFLVRAGSTPPGPDGSFANLAAVATSGAQRSQAWEGTLSGLQAGTQYHVTVMAADEQGRREVRTERFGTLRRRVEVDFERIYVVDDGDDLGAGEVLFTLQANDERPVWLDYTRSDVPAARSGGWISALQGGGPLGRVAIENAPETLRLAVLGQEDDCGGFLSTEFCPPFARILRVACARPNSGCGARTDQLRTGSGESYTQPFQVEAPSDELHFVVHGSYTVSYAP